MIARVNHYRGHWTEKNIQTLPARDLNEEFGLGFFETLLVLDSQIYRLSEHLDRLHSSCETVYRFRPELPSDMRKIIQSLLPSKDCFRLKILLKIHQLKPLDYSLSLLLFEQSMPMGNIRLELDQALAGGLNPSYKSLNYAADWLRFNERNRSFDDYLRTDAQGLFYEAGMANLLRFKNEVLEFVQAPKCLMGTMQEAILSAFSGAKKVVSAWSQKELLEADTLIYSNAVHGPQAVEILGDYSLNILPRFVQNLRSAIPPFHDLS